ncbi:glucose-6-phosphate isomerase [Leucobacter sp. UCMA 4100]|uniref:glucose-6-phosphate isomerase n=1 Tax=Leucobacter sp. UCMA 4100 TaxID=2810534 RepID=UPI0022EA135B|nr:glucose-6-phosphate isomerase [Leucobacter sp. UCMA 4100]MDA3148287.1 glucose-6-phosphate isomerase [Leucobacter sp. UCMA 4100]
MSSFIKADIDDAALSEASIDYLVASKAASRLREGDASLWGKAAAAEASERLGWVSAASDIVDVIAQGEELCAKLSTIDYSRVLLCGMGGSSLAPQVMTNDSPIPLIAIDSIHPDFIAATMSAESLAESVVIVSSKSGGTSETRTQLAICEDRMSKAGINAAERIIVITDPDSELEEHARLRGYKTVLGHPHVGGRYSALTVFGMIPAMVAGAKLDEMAPSVFQTVRALSRDSADNPAIRVASALKIAVERSGTAQFFSPELPGLPAWIEQLVAESTGKDGRGLLPIARTSETVTPTGGMVVHLREHETAVTSLAAEPEMVITGPLGVHFYFWEVVTSLLCVLLEVNPFDQHDVERTKRAARGMKPGDLLSANVTEPCEGLEVTVGLSKTKPETLDALLTEFIGAAEGAAYVVIQAFLPERSEALEALAKAVEDRSGTPATVSYGPSYLHSTGQLHKGGQPGGLFLSVYEKAEHDIQVPGTITSLGWLCETAAMADQKVLRGLDRRLMALRVANTKVLSLLAQHL